MPTQEMDGSRVAEPALPPNQADPGRGAGKAQGMTTCVSSAPSNGRSSDAMSGAASARTSAGVAEAATAGDGWVRR
jgi:hypothetical protein